MPNSYAPGQGKKAFYLFLCSIFGIILFTTIQQFLWEIYQDLVALGYLHQAPVTVFVALFALLIAILLGLWYGIWLGLYWYSFVYENGRSPWFHAFRGGHGRSSSSVRQPQMTGEQSFSTRASAERWQLESLLDDKPSGFAGAKSGNGGRSVSIRSVEVAAPDREVATMESPKRRVRKTSTTVKSSRTRRAAGNGSIDNNDDIEL